MVQTPQQFQDGLKVRACNVCKVYVTLFDNYASQVREKAFDGDHIGHPKKTCPLIEVERLPDFKSVNEKYSK